MELKRSKFQGVFNIIKFNWHFYLISFCAILLCGIIYLITSNLLSIFSLVILFSIGLSTIASLAISYYVYDYLLFYELGWLEQLKLEPRQRIGNISAGFDETSYKLVELLKPIEFYAFDFYDPEKHSEVSIKRARKAGLIYPNTISISTEYLDGVEGMDCIFLIFSLHEIRNEAERIHFISELKNRISKNGQLVIVEHLRDLPNFMAFNIGFFHFYSKKNWLSIFSKAQWNVQYTQKINPFVRIFVLN